MDGNVLFNIVDIGLKLAIALIGFYLANSLRRRIALRVSEKRLSAYASLWQMTGMASPVRLREGGAGALNWEERLELHDKLSEWYYKDGNGMLLSDGTRTMFLKAKDNLALRVKDDQEQDKLHGERVIAQLSLLRTRMKADLGIFGIHYGDGLDDDDKQFLTDCGESLWRRPWRRPFRQRLRGSRNTIPENEKG